jgi:hypothetical protein
MKKWALVPLAFALTLITVVILAHPSRAQTPSGTVYYVDFSGGNDAASGTTPESAWKHAPGDPEATGNPGAVDLQPGDSVSFKGGVVYRGNISINASGSDGSPITFRGNGWGEAKAVIDGSAAMTTPWAPCPSQAACGDNPNWHHLYYTAAPTGTTFAEGFFEDASFIWQAQDPNPDDPFYYDRIDDFRVIPLDDPSVSQTRTSITDPRHFAQSDPGFWDGAYVAVWRIPNVTVIKKITSFDPATHTITHEDLGGDIYTDRDTYYAVLNHLSVLDRPGEYVLDENLGRFYVWPGDSRHPDQHAYSVNQGGTAIYANGRHHLIIEGFDIQKFTFGIRAIGDDASHVTIRDNHVHLLRSNDWYALQVSGADMVVENNAVTDCQRAVGILAGGEHITVKENLVQRTSRQGIWFMGVEHGAILENQVFDIKGTHSNGISVYLHHKDILVAGNHVWDTNLALTYHGDDDPDVVNNLIIYNNLFENSAYSWGKGMRGVTVLNNTFVGGIFMPDEDRDVVFANNITHGGGGGARSYNLYTGLSWNQQPRYGWAPGPGEIVDWDPATEQYEPIDAEEVFVDPDGDYHLIPGSLAADSGTDVTNYLPDATTFPDVDLAVDMDGNTRPWGAGFDMGAFEFVPALVLRGAPADRAIRLSWTVNTTLPVTSTWQLDYESEGDTSLVPPLSLPHATRAHTLSGLTNGLWYTVTLRSMLGSNVVLADAVRVMPTGQFVHLPLVLR